MKKKVDNAEKVTLGFAVNDAPLWLCKELSNEAKKFYNNSYYPVIVGWYRKAKEYDHILRGGVPEHQEPTEELVVDEKEEKQKVPKLFGD